MTIKEITALLIALKPDIADDYRCTDDPDDDTPGMLVTVATTDGGAWSYQTGDNSYTGGCYHYRYWSVIYLHRDSNCRELAREAYAECMEPVHEERRERRDAKLRKRFAQRSPFTLWIAPYRADCARFCRFVFPYCTAVRHAACV